MTKLKIFYFKHIMKRQAPLEKMTMLGKIEGSGKRSNMRWIDFIKEAVGLSLQDPSRAVEGGTLWMSLIHGSPGVRADSVARKTHKRNLPERPSTINLSDRQAQVSFHLL